MDAATVIRPEVGQALDGSLRMYASEYPEEVDGIRSNEDAKATTWSRFPAPLALGG
jgi:hypothetical protein